MLSGDLGRCILCDAAANAVRLHQNTRSKFTVEVVTQGETIVEELSLFSSVGPNQSEYESRECCQKAYLRSSFMARGSVSDPHKSDYHLEISTTSNNEAI